MTYRGAYLFKNTSSVRARVCALASAGQSLAVAKVCDVAIGTADGRAPPDRKESKRKSDDDGSSSNALKIARTFANIARFLNARTLLCDAVVLVTYYTAKPTNSDVASPPYKVRAQVPVFATFVPFRMNFSLYFRKQFSFFFTSSLLSAGRRDVKDIWTW